MGEQTNKVFNEAKIKELFKAHGIVYTRQRAAVFEYMENVDLPQTAAQIALGLEEGSTELPANKKSNNKTWLSTVYRSLELFVQTKLATEFRLPQGEALAYYLNTHAHKHYAICTACNVMLDLSMCPMAEIEAELSKQDFNIASHRIEIYGLCEKCSK